MGNHITKFLEFPLLPVAKKGLGTKVKAGELWVVNANGGSPIQIVEGRGFRSPIFLQDENELLALKEDQIVQIKVSGFIENAHTLFSDKGITRLVGVLRNDPDQVLILLKDDRVAILSLESGAVTPMPEESSPKMIRMVKHMRGLVKGIW